MHILNEKVTCLFEVCIAFFAGVGFNKENTINE
jgi:hypothetical protein